MEAGEGGMMEDLEQILRSWFDQTFTMEGITVNIVNDTSPGVMSAVNLGTYISDDMVRLPNFRHTVAVF